MIYLDSISYPENSLKKEIENYAKTNVLISKYLESFYIYNFDFKRMLIKKEHSDLKSGIKKFFNFQNYLDSQVLINEAIINEKILISTRLQTRIKLWF